MRKTTIVKTTDGRDKGKTFLLTEMPASQAEKWAMRALMIAARNGLDIPANLGVESGMQGIAVMGIKTVLQSNFDDIEPLLDEMMQCVQVMPDPANPNVVRRLIEDDIEEIKTRLLLRQEVLKLHTDFSSAESSQT